MGQELNQDAQQLQQGLALLSMKLMAFLHILRQQNPEIRWPPRYWMPLGGTFASVDVESCMLSAGSTVQRCHYASALKCA